MLVGAARSSTEDAEEVELALSDYYDYYYYYYFRWRDCDYSWEICLDISFVELTLDIALGKLPPRMNGIHAM